MRDIKYPAFSPKQVPLDMRVRLDNLNKLMYKSTIFAIPKLQNAIEKLQNDNLDEFTQAMEKRFPGGN